MTLTIEFIKDNTPTPEQQLALFKEILNFYNVENIHWVSNLSYEDSSKVKKLAVSTRLDNYIMCDKKIYLTNTIYKMFEQLAVEVQKKQIFTILKPQESPYIYTVQQDNEIDLIGVIRVL